MWHRTRLRLAVSDRQKWRVKWSEAESWVKFSENREWCAEKEMVYGFLFYFCFAWVRVKHHQRRKNVEKVMQSYMVCLSHTPSAYTARIWHIFIFVYVYDIFNSMTHDKTPDALIPVEWFHVHQYGNSDGPKSQQKVRTYTRQISFSRYGLACMWHLKCRIAISLLSIALVRAPREINTSTSIHFSESNTTRRKNGHDNFGRFFFYCCCCLALRCLSLVVNRYAGFRFGIDSLCAVNKCDRQIFGIISHNVSIFGYIFSSSQMFAISKFITNIRHPTLCVRCDSWNNDAMRKNMDNLICVLRAG